MVRSTRFGDARTSPPRRCAGRSATAAHHGGEHIHKRIVKVLVIESTVRSFVRSIHPLNSCVSCSAARCHRPPYVSPAAASTASSASSSRHPPPRSTSKRGGTRRWTVLWGGWSGRLPSRRSLETSWLDGRLMGAHKSSVAFLSNPLLCCLLFNRFCGSARFEAARLGTPTGRAAPRREECLSRTRLVPATSLPLLPSSRAGLPVCYYRPLSEFFDDTTNRLAAHV